MLAPATVQDARGMLCAALADPDPVVMFEHAMLYNMEGEVADAVASDIDIAAIRRSRRHGHRFHADHLRRLILEDAAAAEQLAKRGIDC